MLSIALYTALCTAQVPTHLGALQLDAPQHLMIVVDDVKDRSTAMDKSPSCSALPYPKDDDLMDLFISSVQEGKCTLRAAMALANKRAIEGHNFTVALRPGRYRLISAFKGLPEVVGHLWLVGSAADPDAEPGTAKLVMDSRTGATRLVNIAPPDNAPQPDSVTTSRKGVPYGQASAIASVIDGGNRVQLLRVAAGASLHLRTLRLEAGVAFGDAATDSRSVVGGAICSAGRVVLDNVAIRKCRAMNGGGVYSEGSFEALRSQLEYNSAERCGGFLYSAHGSPAHFELCKLGNNHDRCNKVQVAPVKSTDSVSRGPFLNVVPAEGGLRTLSEAGSGATGKQSRIGGQANTNSGQPMAGASSGHADGALSRAGRAAAGGGDGGGKRVIDVSGAVSEGPSLLNGKQGSDLRLPRAR